MQYDFNQIKFFDTVNDLIKLPPQSIYEVAVVGRSNAGKSSMINAITNRNKLAFTSKTPGRTQFINYFNFIEEGRFLVDLPGYGYAKVPQKIRDHWVELLGRYLQTRNQLVGLILIMDSRHPLKDLDLQMINFLRPTNKPIHLVLSKADKLTHQEKMKTLAAVKQQVSAMGSDINYTVQLFSTPKRVGITEVQDMIRGWLMQTSA